MRLLAVCLLALVAAGCSHSSPVPDRGLLDGGSGFSFARAIDGVGAKEAARKATSARGYFVREIRVAARRRPEERFESPPRSDLLRRLRHEAKEHRFQIVSVRMLHPAQLAPLVVVRTMHPVELAHAAAGILTSLNGRYSDRYEGFYLEARDDREVPFFSVYTLSRDRTEGGEWARSEALYPLPHF